MTRLFSKDTPQQLNLNTKGFATFQANTISIYCVPHHPHHQVCFSNPYYPIDGHVIVTREGFEPSTHSLEGCCSIQLSYRASLSYNVIQFNIILYSFNLYVGRDSNPQHLHDWFRRPGRSSNYALPTHLFIIYLQLEPKQ